MKILAVVFIFIQLQFAYSMDIQLISNTSENNILILPSKLNKLVELNLLNGERNFYTLPQGKEGESVIGIFLDTNKIILLKQWIHEGGQNPTVYILEKGKTKWTEVGNIDCDSFDKINFKKDKITVKCESVSSESAGYLYKDKILTLKNILIGLNETIELPIVQSQNESFSVKINKSNGKIVKINRKTKVEEVLKF